MAAPDEVQLPVPPFFIVPHLNNFRDAALYNGGLITNTGHKVRPGILYRSAEVSQLNQAGWAAVKEAGVKTVFDLRSMPEVLKGWGGVVPSGKEGPEEIGEDGIPKDGMGVRDGWIKMMEAEGLDRVWCPVFADADYSPERLAERYMKYMGESSEVGNVVLLFQHRKLEKSQSSRFRDGYGARNGLSSRSQYHRVRNMY
jgi:hypothetical protein